MNTKKIMSSVLFLVMILTILIPFNVEAKNNPYRRYWQYIEGTRVSNCIYVAWDEAKRNTGLELPYWGLAGRKEETSWLPKAEKAGFEIGKEARANSIAVYEGHVAYVLSVSKDGKTMITNQGGVYSRKVDKETGEVTIEPKNGTGTVFNYKVSAKVGPKSWSGLELFGFIYLDVVPGFVPTTTVAGESIPTSPTSKISNYIPKSTKTTSSKETTEKIIISITTTHKQKNEESILDKINDSKEKISFYKAVCSMLALLILGLLLVTTYIYKNKR